MASLPQPRAIIAIGALAGVLWLGGSRPAAADLRLCNTTQSRVGVAIGYKDGDGWTTEGWWNVAARSCETILRGPLVARYYYLYAVDYDQGGEWSGRAFMCSRDKEFTIRGIEQCLARGYDRLGFFEVDTQDQRQWTVQLTDEGQRPAQPNPPMATPAPPVGPQRRPDPTPASSGQRSTPLPTAPAGSGGGQGGVQGNMPAFTAPR
ncbi:MAG: hypothetical protein FD152_2844 [Xanthobacteraceae bacterium]|nr:MAG: hypothetical protein FD152_2844 [Xanthobacteraceae bacterium]